MGHARPSEIAWRGDRPVALPLGDWLRGQEIIHAEHEVDRRGCGLLRLRLRGRGTPQVLITPIAPEAGAPNPGNLRWALKFSAGRTPRIWTPQRSMLGDGPVAVRDLQRLVGRVFLGVETGAQTQEGLAVVKLNFEQESPCLVLPEPLPFALALATLCTVIVRVYFMEPIPTGPYTPGAGLLE